MWRFSTCSCYTQCSPLSTLPLSVLLRASAPIWCLTDVTQALSVLPMCCYCFFMHHILVFFSVIFALVDWDGLTQIDTGPTF